MKQGQPRLTDSRPPTTRPGSTGNCWGRRSGFICPHLRNVRIQRHETPIDAGKGRQGRVEVSDAPDSLT